MDEVLKDSAFRILVREASDGVMILNEAFEIIYANNAAHRIFGYPPSTLLGQPLNSLIPERIRARHDVHRQNFVKSPEISREMFHRDMELVGKRLSGEEFPMGRQDGGDEIPVGITLVKIENEGQNFIATIVRDISHQKDAEKIIRNYMRELNRSHEALSVFSHTAAHDLKAPLRHIQQYCELLQEKIGDRLGVEETGYVSRMLVNSSRMQKLVDDLLSYADVVSAREEKQELDLNKIVEEVTESLGAPITESHAVINAGHLPVLRAYPLRIKQLLQNLIANGIKYRSGKDPVISVEYADRDTDYLFSVRDNGIGVPKEDYEIIFKAFERLHSMDKIEGSGLGLAICAQAVEMHEGKIWVESKPGEGSVFYFTIPKQADGDTNIPVGFAPPGNTDGALTQRSQTH